MRGFLCPMSMNVGKQIKGISRVSLLILVVALFLTILMIPILQYPKVIYGSKVVNSSVVIDWISSWWQRFVRHILGQYGPAETATPNQTTAQNYHLDTSASVANIIKDLKTNKALYSARLQEYLTENGLTNRKGQLDLFITPDNIYMSFVWTGTTYEVYDGWIGDENCPIYATATITSSLMKDLYNNIDNPETLRSLILNGQAQGTLDYTIHRLTVTASATGITDLGSVEIMQIASALASIIGWCVLVVINIRKK
jgi:hypothetical protein